MALYMNGQEISQSSGVPIAVGGVTEIDSTTPTSLNGILKGNGSTVQTAIAGTDYATVEQAKTFVVTFTIGDETITADKTYEEMHTALTEKRNVIGLLPPYVLTPVYYYHEEETVSGQIIFSNNVDGSAIWLSVPSSGAISFQTVGFQISPDEASSLPASGTALTDNTIYAVTTAVGTYAFTPPATGWAHGKFTTGSSVSVSFTGTFLGAAPTIEASKTYEFDVLDGVWAVQEVVSA